MIASAAMRSAFVIPALDAERTIGALASELAVRTQGRDAWLEPSVIVVDDGSSDRTAEVARAAGAEVVRHDENRGKGAALLTGLRRAHERGARTAVTLDADGQHPAGQAYALALSSAPDEALVLAVRDLRGAGAPRKNRFSNAFSNVWMSLFTRQLLRDTQCGLRRYPLPETLELGARGTGFDFEAEVILRAVRRGIPLVHVPARVVYPPEGERTTHFDAVRDPARIVYRILHTVLTTPSRSRSAR